MTSRELWESGGQICLTFILLNSQYNSEEPEKTTPAEQSCEVLLTSVMFCFEQGNLKWPLVSFIMPQVHHYYTLPTQKFLAGALPGWHGCQILPLGNVTTGKWPTGIGYQCAFDNQIRRKKVFKSNWLLMSIIALRMFKKQRLFDLQTAKWKLRELQWSFANWLFLWKPVIIA